MTGGGAEGARGHTSQVWASSHLAAAHADVLALGEGLADVNRAVGRRDHLHLGHLFDDTEEMPTGETISFSPLGFAIAGSRGSGGAAEHSGGAYWAPHWAWRESEAWARALRLMISIGRSNSSIMQSGMAPPQGLQLSILRSMRKVSIPALASTSAAHAPAGPPPTTCAAGAEVSRIHPGSTLDIPGDSGSACSPRRGACG